MSQVSFGLSANPSQRDMIEPEISNGAHRAQDRTILCQSPCSGCRQQLIQHVLFSIVKERDISMKSKCAAESFLYRSTVQRRSGYVARSFSTITKAPITERA